MCSARTSEFRFLARWSDASSRDIAARFPPQAQITTCSVDSIISQHLDLPQVEISMPDYYRCSVSTLGSSFAEILWMHKCPPSKWNLSMLGLFTLRAQSPAMFEVPVALLNRNSVRAIIFKEVLYPLNCWSIANLLVKTRCNISAWCILSFCVTTKIQQADTTHLYIRFSNREPRKPTGAKILTHAQEAWRHHPAKVFCARRIRFSWEK